jgi:hypothetical protein
MGGMVLIFLLLVAGVIAAKKVRLIGASSKPDGSSVKQNWPVYARRVLTQSEQKCFYRLRTAFPDHIVLSQVSMSQLLGVKKGQGKNYHAVFNRYRQLTADFVVCNKDFSVAAVFELDDRSHDDPGRQGSDARKSEALAAAGVPLHRLNSARIPDESQLRQLQINVATQNL